MMHTKLALLPRLCFVVGIIFISVIALQSVYTMSILKKKCIFSAVEGVVTHQGIPIEGAEVVRYYKWQGPDKSNRENAKTTNEGKFSFPAVFDNAILASIFPHSPSIQQEIHIQYQGKEYEAYMLMKNNYELNGELDGKRLCLRCDLQDEPINEDGFYGICRLVNAD